MRATNLIFKRNISPLGVLLFVVVSSFTLSVKTIKWTLNSFYRSVKWIRNYWNFVQAGYSYEDICNLIKAMDSREFEIFCALIFKELGFKVKLTKPSNDYGRDIILDDNIFIECKHYSKNSNISVGREICQKLLGSMQMMGAEKGIIINTGKYHKNAKECEIMVDNLELWDTLDLMKMIEKINIKRLPIILMKTFGTNTKIIKLNLA